MDLAVFHLQSAYACGGKNRQAGGNHPIKDPDFLAFSVPAA